MARLQGLTEHIGPSIEQLFELSVLEEDWDTYGGLPPTCAALVRATSRLIAADEMIGQRHPDGARPFAILPLADGGLQLEWRGHSTHLEIEVWDVDPYGYLLVEGRATDRRTEEGDVGSLEPALQLIARILND